MQRKASENLVGDALTLKEPILNQLISKEDTKTIWKKRFSEDLTNQFDEENERRERGKRKESSFRIILDDSASSLSDTQEASPEVRLKANPFNVSLIQNQIDNELFATSLVKQKRRAKSSDSIYIDDNEYQIRECFSAGKSVLKKGLYDFSTDIQEDEIIQIAEDHMKKRNKIKETRKKAKSSEGLHMNKAKSFVIDTLLRRNDSLVKTQEGLFKLGEKVVFDPCPSKEKSPIEKEKSASPPTKFSFDGWKKSIDEAYADEEYSERESMSHKERKRAITHVQEVGSQKHKFPEKVQIKEIKKIEKEAPKPEEAIAVVANNTSTNVNQDQMRKISLGNISERQVAKTIDPLDPQNLKAFSKEIQGFSGLM